MVTSDWLVEIVREKDEWRSVIMEYGGQCVTMAGIKQMLTSSADNWDMGSQVLQVIIKHIFSSFIQQISSIFLRYTDKQQLVWIWRGSSFAE